jgi:hypothetical protein
VLSKTVEIRLIGKPGAELEILRLEDELRRRSVEQHLVPSGNGEGERILLVIELESRSLARATFVLGTRNDGLGDLVDLFIRVVDHHMEALVCLVGLSTYPRTR